MAQLTYDEFVNKYYPGGGHAQDWLQGAYNKYVGRVESGVISGGGITPTTAPPTSISPSGASYNHETGILTYPEYGFTGTLEEWHAFHPEPLEYEAMPGKPRPEETPISTAPTAMPAFGADIPTPTIAPPPEVPPITVTPAPAYEISPEQQAMADMLGTKITDWVEAGGYGLPPEVQAQMIQQQTDSLKAREQENIRVMRNNMERRGITNSGFLYANEQNIRSNTSVAIAGAIADVQIKSALMKMASFEKAMGAAAQFLGYLSEQSQLAYAPTMATWQAQTQADITQWETQQQFTFAHWQTEQMATMQAWQAQLDIYKIELNQAYQTQNLELQAQLQSDLNEQQHQFDIDLLNMEIEATQQAAQAQGIGNIIGTILGIGASLIFGVPLFGF